MTPPAHGGSAPGRRGLDHVGVVEWLRPGEHERVERLLAGLRRLGIARLRTGISWADYHTPEGAGWYDWLLPRLAQEVELLPCFTCTPPSLAVVAKASAPPREPRDYADFLDLMITRHGRHFDWVELWNEPNNINDWDWRLDPGWQHFARMVGGAAHWAHRRGKRTVLGGMCPTDPNWLDLMSGYGALAHMNVVGLHAFPGTWQHEGESWPHLVGVVREVLERHGHDPEIWVTEVGYSTWRNDDWQQAECFLEALAAPVGRVYWYAYQDLDPELESQEGFHVDERHYHLGLVDAAERPKLLFRLLAEGGVAGLQRLRELRGPAAPAIHGRSRVVVTGGAGFLGCNLVDRLARDGRDVLVYDSLARRGAEANLAWLRERHGDRVAVEVCDLRDRYSLRDCIRGALAIFHLGAQVAVTSSFADPRTDFEVNLAATFELLELLRLEASPPPLVFASTNKVYGDLADIPLVEAETRWRPADAALAEQGIGEGQPLAFNCPYGCSKGAADQYVLDYARSFGLPATVLRMGCVYGPHQRGTEDQGWLAHFVRAALEHRPITVYGDGKQVRDALHVEDGVEAYLLAEASIGRMQGEAFNLGGGPANTLSLIELLDRLERLCGRRPLASFAAARQGDQGWYVSDSSRFARLCGWQPRVPLERGIASLLAWCRDNPARQRAPATATGPRR